MVRAPKFSSKQVTTYSFTPLPDEQDEPTGVFRRQCSTVRNQNPGTGYTNLLSHVRQKHPNYETIMTASGAGSETLVALWTRSLKLSTAGSTGQSRATQPSRFRRTSPCASTLLAP
ncbi:hypothetical protein PI125_g24536 [Phytophthora idaei]|nr:hypothetical protein PI125_g24536 [Phytophthora idaei]